MSADFLPTPQSPIIIGEPAWDIALMYPLQGGWSEDDYLSVAFSKNWLIEYTDGCIEVLPMPTIEHQLIVRFLLDALSSFVERKNLGIVLFAPLPVRTVAAKYREPDLIFNFAKNHKSRAKKYYKDADLVMEVVSEDEGCRQRDYQTKRRDYAEAQIPEYWIVDSAEKRITVLALAGDQYAEHGAFGPGEKASSRLLDGFTVEVDAVMAAGKA